ncbi:Uu.00g101680.m01.CDS01 [Anthostomella pinea]|uniref:Uu.00g101680.m01.CDS01 n=1 Tax=Anthostomella pinea TaxID=933095 RepID=A0AAI8YFK1_9PEZI|nr:Uu.00g101680.m01.CDS01 [Anthostomella pinea]
MRASTILTALAGASSASAAVMRLATTSLRALSYDWAVTGWSAGCARAGCYYDFNITGDANTTAKPQRPGFKAYCSGQEGEGYRACTQLDSEGNDAEVVAKLFPHNITANGTSSLPHIQVSLRYTDLDSASTWWNYTGDAYARFNQFVAPPMNFSITPDEVFGVA